MAIILWRPINKLHKISDKILFFLIAVLLPLLLLRWVLSTHIFKFGSVDLTDFLGGKNIFVLFGTIYE